MQYFNKVTEDKTILKAKSSITIFAADTNECTDSFLIYALTFLTIIVVPNHALLAFDPTMLVSIITTSYFTNTARHGVLYFRRLLFSSLILTYFSAFALVAFYFRISLRFGSFFLIWIRAQTNSIVLSLVSSYDGGFSVAALKLAAVILALEPGLQMTLCVWLRLVYCHPLSPWHWLFVHPLSLKLHLPLPLW